MVHRSMMIDVKCEEYINKHTLMPNSASNYIACSTYEQDKETGEIVPSLMYG